MNHKIDNIAVYCSEGAFDDTVLAEVPMCLAKQACTGVLCLNLRSDREISIGLTHTDTRTYKAILSCFFLLSILKIGTIMYYSGEKRRSLEFIYLSEIGQ